MLRRAGSNRDIAGAAPLVRNNCHGANRGSPDLAVARPDPGVTGQLPAVIGPDKALAKQAMAMHELIGYLLLGLIALHAAAALFHHHVRRDDVLRAMLPRRR